MAYETALLVRQLKLAGLDPAVWIPRIRQGANACDVFARTVPDNEDYFRRVDGYPPEDCWCYVRLVPPGPETVCMHPAPGPRDGWTAVLDACCFSHQTAAVDWRACSPLGFRLTTTTSRPAALEAAARMLDKTVASPIDKRAYEVSEEDDEPWDGPWPVGESAFDTMPARIRCLPGHESDNADPQPVCVPCKDDEKIVGTSFYAYFLLTADDQDPVHLCPQCAKIAHAIIEWPSTLQEYDRFDPPFVSYFVLYNGNLKPDAAVWRLPYSEFAAEQLLDPGAIATPLWRFRTTPSL